MALLQISEPGQSPVPHQQKRVAGIDLGTTNSLVAWVRSGSAVTFDDEQGEPLLPSVVWYGKDGPVVGRRACQQISQDPLNTIVSVKRLMGRGIADLKTLGGIMPYRFGASSSAMPSIETSAGAVSPVEVSAEILKTLARRAEATLEGPLDGVVITVPAYFDDAQRQATRDAARLAGLHVYRLLNEPTAAAVAYGLDQSSEESAGGVIAVYDLGGGTFDISILRMEQGVFQVLATGGDTALGGDDFDRALGQWILAQAQQDEQSLDNASLRQLMMEACRAKEALSQAESVELAFGSWSGQLDREQFNGIIDPLVARTLSTFRRTLRDAGVKTRDVREVIMVGGSTRTARVREKVAELVGRPPLVSLDPDRVVALGAAIQADILAGNRSGDDMLLLDVIPLSLGLETMGGLMERVIHRNTTIPVSRAQEFTTYKDGQSAMAIHVFQGERELVQDNRSLARFELRGLPPLPAGAAKIRVTFQVDADGLLSVSARELGTGVAGHIQVKPSYGLDDSEIARMLRESQNHAGEDRDARRLKEQQVEAQRMVEALTQALARDGETLLTQEERQSLTADLDSLRAISQSHDAQIIAREIDRVGRSSEAFAARRMNQGIRQALSGQTIDDWENC